MPRYREAFTVLLVWRLAGRNRCYRLRPARRFTAPAYNVLNSTSASLGIIQRIRKVRDALGLQRKLMILGWRRQVGVTLKINAQDFT